MLTDVYISIDFVLEITIVCVICINGAVCDSRHVLDYLVLLSVIFTADLVSC